MDIKKELGKLWNHDRSYKKLTSITFDEKGFRGLKNLQINFNYPITAIAGQNGVGKTTILQTCACLFHNKDFNFKPYRLSNAKNQNPYYTFSDFFIFSKNENKIQPDTTIQYEYNGKSYNFKRNTYRWGSYERRPERYIEYLAISRVLPSYEFTSFRNTFSQHKNYSKPNQLDQNKLELIRKVLNRGIEKIDTYSSTKISNFKLVEINTPHGQTYSNFNMGAGEEVIISMIDRIISLPLNSLVLIEEIELGLHPLAQKKFLDILMKIVKEKKLQVIFTTHSPYIFEMLPPEGRILLKKLNVQNCKPQISAIEKPSTNLAFLELSGDPQQKLTIYVEDKVSKNILEHLFDSHVSKKVDIIDTGSLQNVIKMLSAHTQNENLGSAIAILDGDVSETEIKKHCTKFCVCNSEKAQEYINELIRKFPGDIPPEKYILNKMKENKDFAKSIDSTDEFIDYIEHLNLDDHHSLFYALADFLNKDILTITYKVIDSFVSHYKEEFENLSQFIYEILEKNNF